MTSEKFVKAFHNEKEDLLKLYLSEIPQTQVGELLRSLKLTEEQSKIMEKILETTLIDAFYGILLGLEGSTSIGGIQEKYNLKDKNGNQLNDGDIGGYAYDFFKKIINV